LLERFHLRGSASSRTEVLLAERLNCPKRSLIRINTILDIDPTHNNWGNYCCIPMSIKFHQVSLTLLQNHHICLVTNMN